MNTRLFLTVCAAAALLAACDTNTQPADRTKAPADTTAPAGTSGSADQAKATIVAGCLQKDGSDYILTQINEPTKGEPVGEQQLKEAEHAYRLNAKNTSEDEWAGLVGHQVRVRGELAKASDLDQQVGTSGSADRPKIREKDLAKLDVTDIEQVAPTCRGK